MRARVFFRIYRNRKTKYHRITKDIKLAFIVGKWESINEEYNENSIM